MIGKNPTNLDEHFNKVLSNQDEQGQHLRAIRSIASETSPENSRVNQMIQRFTPQEIKEAFNNPAVRSERGEIESITDNSFERARQIVEILSYYYYVNPADLTPDYLQQIEEWKRERLSVNPSDVDPTNFENYYRVSHTINILSRTFLNNGVYGFTTKELSGFEAQILFIKRVFRDLNITKTLKTLGFDFESFLKEKIESGLSPEDAHAVLVEEVFSLLSFVRKNVSEEVMDNYTQAYESSMPFRFGKVIMEPLFSDLILELNPEEFDRVLKTLPDIKDTKFSNEQSWYTAYQLSRVN